MSDNCRKWVAAARWWFLAGALIVKIAITFWFNGSVLTALHLITFCPVAGLMPVTIILSTDGFSISDAAVIASMVLADLILAAFLMKLLPSGVPSGNTDRNKEGDTE